MIHLGLGQPDFKTPQHVVDPAKKALDEGHHGYVLSNGILECRQAVTQTHVYLDPSHLLWDYTQASVVQLMSGQALFLLQACSKYPDVALA